jgi:hypothetical protein
MSHVQAQYNLALVLQKEAASKARRSRRASDSAEPAPSARDTSPPTHSPRDKGDEYALVARASRLLRLAAAQGHAKAAAALR